MSSASSSALSGVCSAGFSTTVQPVARAGPSFQAAISSGKFQGMICPTTPTGSRTRVRENTASASSQPRSEWCCLRSWSPSPPCSGTGRRPAARRRRAPRQWLAVVEGFQLRELFQVLLHQVGQLPDEAAALGGGHVGPRAAFKRLARGLDGAIDVFAIAFGNLCQHFAGGRIVDRKGLAGGGFDPLAVDEHLARG